MALTKLFNGNYRLSQKFGNKLIINGVDIYKLSWLAWHNGIDYACPAWTKLLSALTWEVIVKNQGKKWYGLSVTILKNKEDWISEIIYWHLNSTTLKTGALVKAWDFIGMSWGAASSPTSWTSTWAHLHFGLRFRSVKGDVINADNWYLWWIDPLPYFS